MRKVGDRRDLPGVPWLLLAALGSEIFKLPSQGSAESGMDQGIMLPLGTSLSPLQTGTVTLRR